MNSTKTTAPAIQLMIDIETTSTEYNAGILSIAAVPFLWDEPLAFFYERASMVSNESNGFHISSQTMAWWELQSSEARLEAFGGTKTIMQVLSEFDDYVRELPGKVIVWGNGASFDVPIVTEGFDKFGIETPWTYSSSRCYRTLKNLFPDVPALKPVVAHNALDDAKSQAAHATRIFEHLEKLRTLK